MKPRIREGGSRVRIDGRRVRNIREGREGRGPVVLWLSRDQRVRDNWALLHARDLARERKVPLVAVFCLVQGFLGATMRQCAFMLKSLEGTARVLKRSGIPFLLLAGDPVKEIPPLLRRYDAALLLTDFDPLRIKQKWHKKVAQLISVPFLEVDAHNIVPCWAASPKREYGAYTLRPKLRRLLPEFLVPFPPVRKHPYAWKGRVPVIRWTAIVKRLVADRSVPEVSWSAPGEAAAARALKRFIRDKLPYYDIAQNDPAHAGQSGLSPYLHFGQLSAQRVALEVLHSAAPEGAKEAFLEELITRRELSDNFCFYTPDYDAASCFPDWAKRTLAKHRQDKREYLYSLREFEKGMTHDRLWNAAQQEMVYRGKMHGYLRMYWAKKILEWTRSPDEAMKIAIYLNDRYELDGRDPNGYAGIAWSIGGVHDRPWGERKIFGMVRYMGEQGCRSKFDVDGYVERIGKMTRDRSSGSG